jgi:methionyl-tRNA formyltransferase
MIRTVFMGTPAFAVPSLRALLDNPAYALVGVVTQPDREAGRGGGSGRRRQMSPVKEAALAAGVPVLQPERLRRPEAFAQLAALAAEMIIVAAYGQILRPEVLALPRFGCLNVHASLLPRWRGAAPIAAAILAGDAVTGSTIMLMDEGMDTGPILAQAEEAIRPDDTAGSLGERLAQQGAGLLMRTLPAYLAGQLTPRPQPEVGVSLCRPLQKEHGQIDWQQPAALIERMVRAFDPWPGAFTTWEGQQLKIGRAQAIAGEGEPGRVQRWQGQPAIGAGEGLLLVSALQLAGRKMLGAREFLAGRPDFIGAALCPPVIAAGV